LYYSRAIFRQGKPHPLLLTRLCTVLLVSNTYSTWKVRLHVLLIKSARDRDEDVNDEEEEVDGGAVSPGSVVL